MKRFINSIHIFGKEYPIYEVDLGDEYEGLFENDEIKISKTLPKRQRKQPTTPEVLHALLNRGGVRQMNVSEEAEEIIVDNIAKWLCECREIEYRIKGLKW